MLLRFKVTASVSTLSPVGNKTSGMCQYPANVIKRVIICNRDGCSYQHVVDVKDGKFDVDFELRPLQEGAVLCDTLKFHFYSGDDIPVVLAAGGVDMRDVGAVMAHQGSKQYTFNCNFAPVGVTFRLEASAPQVRLDLSGLAPSTLSRTSEFMRLTQLTCNEVSHILSNNLVCRPEDGAPMFCNLMTAHNMQNEATTHTFYQSDIEPTGEDARLFYESGLTMTALAHALHAKCMTADDVLKLDAASPVFSAFVTEVCQAFIRSAHLNPYVSDEVVAPSLDAAGRVVRVLSECFKLPFREPFLFDAQKSGYLHADDCEGHATFMYYLFGSFRHLYEKKVPADRVFPAHMFPWTDAQKAQLHQLANKIGQLSSEGSLRCDIILISAGSAALNDGGNQLGGHATAVIVNTTNKEAPHDVLMEGTNSMTWDEDARTITCVKANLVSVQIPMVMCANMLTKNIATLFGEVNENDCRMLAHMDKELETKFYKVAFCQNGQLLATPAGTVAQLNFGVNMQCISDYSRKVFMPITKTLINKITGDQKAHDFMDQHRTARRSEIHPPRTDLANIQQAVSHWSPIEPYEHAPQTQGRQFKVCLAMKSIRDPAQRAAELAASKPVLADWNAKYKDVGYCTTYVAFDTMFTRLCMYTDDLSALQRALSAALTDNQPCSGTS
jgi:hypothetical protein